MKLDDNKNIVGISAEELIPALLRESAKYAPGDKDYASGVLMNVAAQVIESLIIQIAARRP